MCASIYCTPPHAFIKYGGTAFFFTSTQWPISYYNQKVATHKTSSNNLRTTYGINCLKQRLHLRITSEGSRYSNTRKTNLTFSKAVSSQRSIPSTELGLQHDTLQLSVQVSGTHPGSRNPACCTAGRHMQ